MDAIILDNVSKKYMLSQDRPVLLKNLFFPSKKEEVWALKNISLTIKKGETIGIIGDNGSGKSTLLKIISGITTPTEGSIKVNGRICSIIELGAGFHPDLTGKENVYLNATLLGLTKKEIDKKYKEIVDFADIGKFIDQPVRTYSSGMTMRLGFSVAVHLDPDILLIDEVLAVGDEEFQGKSFRQIQTFKQLSKTIIIVSHNLFILENTCSKLLLMSKGKIQKIGNPKEVIEYYLHFYQSKSILPMNNITPRKNIEKLINIHSINIFNYKRVKKYKFNVDECLIAVLEYENLLKPIKISFGLTIYDITNTNLYGFSTKPILTEKGKGKVEFVIPRLPPTKGALTFVFDIADLINTIKYDSVISSPKITIVNKPNLYRGIIDYDCRYYHKLEIKI